MATYGPPDLDIQPGELAQITVLPYVKGEVVDVRDGEYEDEVVIRPFNDAGGLVIVGLRNVRRLRQWERV